jgi:pyruvoyl-dependent arginine decarboxylase (PvlArgDC)
MSAITDKEGGRRSMSFLPRGMFLTKGVGRHREELHSSQSSIVKNNGYTTVMAAVVFVYE